MSIRVYLEKNVTPEVVEEALPLIRALHKEVKGTELVGLNAEYFQNAMTADVMRAVAARDGPTLVGFLVMYVCKSALGVQEATITHIFVDKKYRGKTHAVGAQMISVALAIVDALGIRCEYIAEKEHVINLFLQAGFKPAGIKMGYNNGK